VIMDCWLALRRSSCGLEGRRRRPKDERPQKENDRRK